MIRRMGAFVDSAMFKGYLWPIARMIVLGISVTLAGECTHYLQFAVIMGRKFT